jgi:hypothetical protein
MLPSLYEYLKLLMTVVIFENYLEEQTQKVKDAVL